MVMPIVILIGVNPVIFMKTPGNDFSSEELGTSTSSGEIWILRLKWDSARVAAIDHFATVAADVAANTTLKFVHLHVREEH